ncbi:MAG TPA: glycosyltransferase family 4 protein [Longimicrobium sp.]|jgi:glycosyltransferase involved in cell wall biosynthesis
MARPVVLTFVHYYLPGYKSGGPIRTLANLVDHLGEELDFRIVTADRDATDTAPYPDVAPDAWNAVGKARVFYASPGARGVGDLAHVVAGTPHDVLYFNSFFDAVFTVRTLVGRAMGRFPRRPVIIAPRGELAPSALAYKRWKKEPYLKVFRALGMQRAVTWQASSQYEADDILRVMRPPPASVRIAPNLPAAERVRAPRGSRGAEDGPLRIVFLARVSPVKNLDFALRVLGRVTAPVELDIYGPVRDPAYWARCEEMIDGLPPHVKARYHGPVEPARVPGVMADHDLFFLPTQGENYGHVIPEALSAGTPVLIANTTPWRGLEAAGAGWDLPLDDEASFAARIEHYAALPPARREAMRESAYEYVCQRLAAPGLVEANRELFMAGLTRTETEEQR